MYYVCLLYGVHALFAYVALSVGYLCAMYVCLFVCVCCYLYAVCYLCVQSIFCKCAVYVCVCLSCVMLVCSFSECCVSFVCVGRMWCGLDVLCLWVPLLSVCVCA